MIIGNDSFVKMGRIQVEVPIFPQFWEDYWKSKTTKTLLDSAKLTVRPIKIGVASWDKSLIFRACAVGFKECVFVEGVCHNHLKQP